MATPSLKVPDYIQGNPFASGRPRVGLRGTLTAVGLLILVGWAWRGTQVSPTELVTNIPNMADFIHRLFPPDWRFFLNRQQTIEPTIATMQLAITGTVIAVILSLPLCLLAARNLSNPVIYQAMRAFLNVIRSIPELVWAHSPARLRS